VPWLDSVWSVSHSSIRTYSVSIRIKLRSMEHEWWLTSVYGPTRDPDKASFLTELHKLRTMSMGTWMLNGYFNMIYRVEDKNNDWLNRRLMGQFWHFLN
jgi:hypothetical protein